MDLRHFFNGQQSKENAASAWLATLLEYDSDFRVEFFKVVPPQAALDPAATWTVDVETPLNGSCDVTLETADTFLFLEDKIAASARMDRQFVRYYEAAAASRPDKALIGLYLGPSVATGEAERLEVLASPIYSTRQAAGKADVVACLGWQESIGPIVAKLAESAWFAHSGHQAVIAHMARIAAGRQPDPQRDVLREIVSAARERLATDGVQLARWPSIGQEAIYTVKSPVTTFLTLSYDEDEDPPNALHNVVDGDRIRLAVGVSIGPSKTGKRNAALMTDWRALTAGDAVSVSGLGDLRLANRDTLATSGDFDGTAEELQSLLVDQGSAALRFVRQIVAGS